jgi:hypothetical protein
MNYRPDCWVVLEITGPDKIFQRVLAGWYGGYLGANTWQLNSGNVRHEEFDDRYEFIGESGSVYVCHKSCQRMSSLMSNTYNNMVSKLPPEYSVRIVENPKEFV